MSDIQRDKFFMTRISYRIDITKKKDTLWNCKCPVSGCDDYNRKKRFYFVDKGTYILAYCHDCGYSANLRAFIKDKFPELSQEYKFWGFAPKKKSLAEETKDAIESIPDATVPTFVSTKRFNSLSVDFNSIVDSHPAKKYVISRQIPFHLVRYCKNYYEFTKSLHQDDTFKKYAIPSMLIPFHRMSDEIEIFQSRFFNPKVKPKYITVKLNQDAKKIYNEDYVDETRTVYIHEGPINSMGICNSVALGGSDGTCHWPDQVWCFDNDKGSPSIEKKIIKKIERGEKVVIWKPSDPFNDINEGIVKFGIPKENFQKMLEERTFSGLKARLEFAKLRRT